MATETKNNTLVNKKSDEFGTSIDKSKVEKFIKRMLIWPNPVEYVNNMYGCHPWEKEKEYFRVIFSDED